MPSYFYHLILELYSYSGFQGAREERDKAGDRFILARGTDIFTPSLPHHPHSRHRRQKSYKGNPGTEEPTHSHRSGGNYRQHKRRASESSKGFPNLLGGRHNIVEQARKEAERDWRYDKVSIESIDMGAHTNGGIQAVENAIEQGTATRAPPNGLANKGVYVPLNSKNTEVGWGVVHLYRDSKETPGLYDDQDSTTGSESEQGERTINTADFDDEACTTLCILAVPSYMTPSDLLGFLGEQTRDDVSHFRLIKTGKSNKYMVLMKFREAQKAKRWQKEWNGKLFNSMDVGTLLIPMKLYGLLTYDRQRPATSSSSTQLSSKPQRQNKIRQISQI